MKTKVGLSHEPGRKLPWLVYWWLLPNDDGKQRKRHRSFRYNREARQFVTDKQAEINHDGPKEHASEVTLGRLCDEFWAARVAGLSNGSQTGYRQTIDELAEHFGKSLPIKRIGQRLAERFMSSRKRKDGGTKPLSSWTKLQRVTHCRAIFDAAIAWGWYRTRNPFKPPAGRSSTPLRVTAKSRPWHHLTPAEFSTFLSVVPNVRRRAAFWLMYGSGLRPGEVYNLTFDRIDLDRRRVHITNREPTEDVPPFTVKSEGRSSDSKSRTVPIPEVAMADVTEACRLAFGAGGFVVLTPERFQTVQRKWRLCCDGQPRDGRKTHRSWVNADMLNNLLRDTGAYLRKAGIELTAPFSLTGFRKSFAQNHAEAGTPPKTLAKLMGHADASVTMAYYNRATDANERAAETAMNRLLGKPESRAEVVA